MSINKFFNPHIRDFVKENKEQIEHKGKHYEITRKKIEKTLEKIKKYELTGVNNKEDESKSFDLIISAIKYLSFLLADYANHNQAKKLGYLNNYYRTQSFRAKGDIKRYCAGLINGFFLGYLEKASRILFTAFFVMLFFSFIYWSIAAVVSNYYMPEDYTSIKFASHISEEIPDIKLYHYVYFSILTLTSLGYGDLTINHSASNEWATFLMMFFCSVEAITGYIILGLCISIFFKRLYIHPYGRIGEWLNAYEASLEIKKPGFNLEVQRRDT